MNNFIEKTNVAKLYSKCNNAMDNKPNKKAQLAFLFFS